MNRDSEFRGKEIKTGRWVYGGYFKHYKRQPCPVNDCDKEEDAVHLIIKSGFADWNMPRGIEAFEVDPKTVGEYTGEKDRKGNKIYEDDVAKYINRKDQTEYSKCLVYFQDSAFFMDEDLMNHIMIDHDIEVIGNVHDNKGLLEEAE